MKNTIEIVTRFKNSQLTAREYINLSKSLLLNLKKFHSIFETINSWGSTPTSWTKINDDFSNFETVVFNHIYDEEIVYTDKSGGKIDYCLDARTWSQFSNSYSNIKKPLQEKYSVSIGAGGEGELGYINIDLPESCFTEFSKTENIIALISSLLTVVELEGAYIYTKNLYDQVVNYDKDYDIEIGWINYLKNTNVLPCIPSEIPRKQEKNGAFFWIKDEMGDIDGEIISSAIKIRDTLGELGYLNIS